MTVTKAITVRPPWSLAIAAGRKLVENRGRNVPYRGPIAIHCAAAWSHEGAADQRIRDWWWGQWSRVNGEPLAATDFAYAFRNILAVADLVDCHEAEQPRNPILVADRSTCCSPWGDRDYSFGVAIERAAWHLVLDNIRPLTTPVPARGSLALPWTLPDDVAAQVNEQLAVAA